jgi:hypothetical protein
MAEHSDPKVQELFGTDTIPTAFGATCGLNFVIRQLTLLNPDVEFRFRGEFTIFD